MLAAALLAPVAVVVLFQAYYLVLSLGVRIRREPGPTLPAGAGDDAPIAVLIPVRDSASCVGRCLAALLTNRLDRVARVVVVLDHCTDGSAGVVEPFVARFAARGVTLDVRPLPTETDGKVAALRYGSGFTRTRDVLLLDADIVLEPTAIEELVAHHVRRAATFSSCLVFPRGPDRRSLASHVVCNNRLYRQGVLQAVKNRFGVANLPGGVQLVDMEAYRRLLVDGFLEDLSATYRILATGGRIDVLPRVLAYEIERETLKGLFLQRVRWTVGALQHVPDQFRTARRRRGLHEKLLVHSYHTMWELQHYVIAAALLAALAGAGPVFLAPAALYALQIARSAFLARRHYPTSLPGLVAHCLVFPWVISAALVGSLVLLARNRSFFFATSSLFRRI